MISFAKHLVVFACIALLLHSCVTRQQVSVGNQSTPEQVVHSTVNGHAEERGKGKLEPEKARQLGQQAHKDMRQNFPAKKGQEYSNLTVSLKRTNYLFYSVYSADMQGNLVSKRDTGTDTESTDTQNNTPEMATPNGASHQADQPNAERPVFIVNARLGSTPWDKLTPWNPAITHLRIPGGSVSQYTWRSWDDTPQWIRNDEKKRSQTTIVDQKMIQAYADFAEAKNVISYYCLNVNDKLENQLFLLDKFYEAGVNITHIELGNETYLPKYRNGDKSGWGYTHPISIADYIALLDEWLPVLRKRYQAEILVVAASRTMNNSRADMYRAQWNDAVLTFYNEHPALVDGFVVHLYGGQKQAPRNEEESIEKIDFSFMEIFPLPVHVTESGTWDADWSASGIQHYKDWHRELYLQLKARNDGSRYGCHVLYNAKARNNHPHPHYNPNGITPIGKAAMEFPYGEP